MDTSSKKMTFKEVIHTISTIISWTVFVLLVICCILLTYYFVSLQIYKTKGSGYEPAFSLYNIASGSMIPNINVYDVIVDVKVKNPEDIEINDVITYTATVNGKSSTITHRVIAITIDSEGNYYYRTKGDNNLVDDGVDIAFSRVVGKVALRIPGLGKLQNFIANQYGWMLVILAIALYILVKSIIKLVKNNLEDKFKDRPSKLRDLFTRPLLSYRPRKLLPEYATVPQVSQESSIFFDDEDDSFDLPKLKQ